MSTRRHCATFNLVVRVTSTLTLVLPYRLSLPVHPHRKMDLSFRRPHTRSRPLPHHRYRHKHLLMCMGQDLARTLSRRTTAPATDRDPYL
ncbi:hypothetical protein BC826DRAFT_982311 [Russula brevipes]|nr:hypothetical protein BC826DRAFT_1084628 [Russula brevipes]KAI0303273.1 hypothetical protein BC826DRAFT_984467 [Russula brevipes]KAI0304244.1 hypothetical protein BC826DRAFT_982311 [Russula brevipes]